jgi:argininosuccinate synthase
MDRNLLHISYESGVLEDPWFDPSAPENEMFSSATHRRMLGSGRISGAGLPKGGVYRAEWRRPLTPLQVMEAE